MKLRARLVVATMIVTVPLSVILLQQDHATRHAAARERLLSFTDLRMSELRAECEADPATFGGETQGNHPPPQRGDVDHPPPPQGSFDHPPPPPPPQRGFDHPPPRDGDSPPPHPPQGNFDHPPQAQNFPPPHARPAVLYAFDASLHTKNPHAPAVSARLREAILEGDARVASDDGFFGDDVTLLVRMPWRDGPCAFVLARGTTDPSWGALLPESQAWLLPAVAVFLAMLFATGPFVARVRRLTRDVSRSAERGYGELVDAHGSDEIAELARAFNAARSEIRARLTERDARERALRDFVANTTHDVMLPLTVLQGHLTTLRDASTGGGDLDRAVIASAMDEAHYIGSLLRDLSVSARLDADLPELVLSDVDLGVLVRRVVARHAMIAKELGVSTDSAVPEERLVIRADETLVEQAINNIVYNAVRYNQRGGHVAVVLESASADQFSLTITDDGVGVSDDELEKMTTRGFRGKEARARRPDGTGLGLHIASRALALHDFSLGFERPASEDASRRGMRVSIHGSTLRRG